MAKDIDATGIRDITDLSDKLKRQGTVLIVSGIHAQPLTSFVKTGIFADIGKENIVPNINRALERAEEFVSSLS